MGWRRDYRRLAAGPGPGSLRGRRARLVRLLGTRLARQTIVSLALLALVVVATGLPLAASRDARTAVRDVLTSDFDVSRLVASLGAQAVIAEWYPGFFRSRDTSPPDGDTVPALWDDDLGVLTAPVDGEVLSWYGWRTPEAGGEEFHTGIDLAAGEGMAVRAAAPGVVTAVYSDDSHGRVLEIRHAGRWCTVYARLGEILAREGDEVDAGDIIATMGASHLHFELLAGGNPVDPAGRLGLTRPR